MSEFTYQENPIGKLENYEWDNVWWPQTASSAKRILYIGDSISCGLRTILTEISDGKYIFDNFGTSKALDNPYFCESLKIFALQELQRDAILFNNGLHGWHLSNREYEKYYRKVLSFIEYEIPAKKIIIVLTTAVDNEERNKIINQRNEIARKIADEFEFPIIDLNKYSLKYKNHRCSDGVHYNDDGCKLLAEELTKDFLKIMVNNE